MFYKPKNIDMAVFPLTKGNKLLKIIENRTSYEAGNIIGIFETNQNVLDFAQISACYVK